MTTHNSTVVDMPAGTRQGNNQPPEAAPFIWPEIIPLNTTLPPVVPFKYALLPDGLAPWVRDIVERTQCPPDFVAVTVMVALASLVGRKAAIHPKQYDDWLVVPNLWGSLIGRPSAMKSPAMEEGLRPLKRLAIKAREQYQAEALDYEVEKVATKQQATITEQCIRTALKSGKRAEIESAKDAARRTLEEAMEPPVERRYIVNDATVEKLGELLNQNPNGLLLERDELNGWLKSLDREDRSNDRAFYLESFGGAGRYTYDRIGRGTLHIESVTVSIIGGLQPSRLRPYVWHAINQGDGDDGLIQRFQLAVYPDDLKRWRNVDRWPDGDAKQEAFEIFERMDAEPPGEMDETGKIKGVRFDEAGQAVFDEWRHELESRIREPGIHPAIESHLTKYRSLMPSLALLINEVEQGHFKPVSQVSAQKATAWCEYLESHAMRIYGGAIDQAAQSAETILERKDKLPDGFQARIVQQKGWAGLVNSGGVKAALGELVECGYLREMKSEKSSKGGRESWSYSWNPAISGEK